MVVKSNLRQARVVAAFSQEALAGRAGISRQAYAAVESGRSVPSTEVALRLARALETTVEALFSLPDEPAVTVQAELVGDAPIAAASRVQLTRVGRRLFARPLVGAAAVPHTLTSAEGVLLGVKGGIKGDKRRATVRLMDAETLRTPILVMAGCDPAVSLLIPGMRERGTRLVWAEEGSREALVTLASGEAHVAGCHLYDECSGRYNAPWVKRLVPFPCTVVRFAQWRQGLIVARGNPLRIAGIEGLARPGVRLVNRQEGSGSRVLLDRLLKREGIPQSALRGYERQVHGHLALAEVVASGLADAGIAVEAAARALGLDFVPLQEERYDLVVPNRFLDLPAVQILLESLRRPQVRGQVEALGGYDAAGMGDVAA
ncbi:MAG: helix-turn-helix domain-containing protein [Dehalococcoidia bacterium]|nr:helix-turn-helix domain-containing protein [Dehalococcoidia bacterium]